MIDFSKLAGTMHGSGSRTLNPHSAEAEQVIHDETRKADYEHSVMDEMLDQPEPPRIDESSRGKSKLSRLIDHDFPFDESQLAAINGMAAQRFACMTGAAGTGKTTSLKKLVDLLQDSTATVDMGSYFKKNDRTKSEIGRGEGFHDDDDYEVTEQFVPAICMCSFTGRASQMIKKNFPRDWHSNIMTIHRMLAYMPEWYEEYDEETQELKNKMRFIPTYNESFKLPWDIVIIDEAGMLGVDLWHNILAALKPGARVYMVGDINQLPPTHGKSIFGFALASWPSWELTHIHRQVGKNNSIVDNAWRVLKGQTPVSDNPKDPAWKFVMMEIPGDPGKASQYLRAWLAKIKDRTYDPIRDSIITPINAYEHTQGYALGQDPLNRQLALMFNENTEENPRYIIDAGRERKYFAVGDKVMATRNDYEAGITNGMTGIITSITRHGNYQGDLKRFGTIKDVNEYLASEADDEDEPEEFSLEDLSSTMDSQEEAKEQAKEGRDRGPASHIVVVKFGDGDTGFEITFSTLAEVASLMTAYVVTCHKMQGGEVPFVVIICHQSHKRMLFREWLYTAITRASGKCVVLFTRQGLMSALSKQNIKGSTLAQKVECFQALQTKGIAGAAINVRLPEKEELEENVNRSDSKSLLEKNREKSRAELMALASTEDDLIPYEPAPEHVALTKTEYVCSYCGDSWSKPMLVCPNCGTRMANVSIEPEVVDGGTLTPEELLKIERVIWNIPRTPLITYQPEVTALAPAWPAEWATDDIRETRMEHAKDKLRDVFTLGLPVQMPKGNGLGLKLNLARK